MYLKVLFVNKYHYIKGGSETALFSQIDLLKGNGHKTISFSMKDENNLPSENSEFFVENINYSDMSLSKKISNAAKIIYSLEAKKKIGKLVNCTKPDIAHLHIFQHQLSPSIIWELKKHNIPIVYTAHDLKVVCPNYIMLTEGKVCEKCVKGQFYHCVAHKCSKNSQMNSIILTVEAYLHKWINTYSYVNAFVSPSKFYLKMLERKGIDKDKLFFIPNFLDVNAFSPQYGTDQDYIVYFGRLSKEKGILTLVDAVSKISNVNLIIVGTGPIKNLVEDKINSLSLNTRVKLAGYKSGEELYDIIRKSKFVVLPSEWYENAPYSVLEAMALGKPVVGSNIGGIPEMVTDGINGYVFSSGDSEELAKVIEQLYFDDIKLSQMGKQSRKIVESKFNSEVYYSEIMKIYERLLPSSP